MAYTPRNGTRRRGTVINPVAWGSSQGEPTVVEGAMSENWVEGTYESGADGNGAEDNDPIEPSDDELETGGDVGVELGIGEGSTFEPEENAGDDPV